MKRFTMLSVILMSTFSTQYLACGLDEKNSADKGDGDKATCDNAPTSPQICEQPDPVYTAPRIATLYESCDKEKPGDRDEGDAPFCFIEPDRVCDQGDPSNKDDNEALFSFLDELYGVCHPGGRDGQTTAGG